MSFLTTLPRELYDPHAFDGFNAGSSQFNPGTGKALAWACQFAYVTSDPAKVASIAAGWNCTVPDRGIISEISATALPLSSTQLIVFMHSGAVIISFAGTDPLSLVDWITDFDVAGTDKGSAVGLSTALQSVLLRIEDLLRSPPLAGKQVFVTGHSLGGALAVLAAQEIDAKQPGRVSAVYTYGMLRAGNAQFKSAYDQALGSRTYRMVHGEDIVPTVPPSSLVGSRHVGRHLSCVRLGKFSLGALQPTTDSDQPQFAAGALAQLRNIALEPLSLLARAGLAAGLTMRTGPFARRTDVVGIVIELLPLPVRDHLPDRYIGGFA
jgi:triacylglycerol lipase